MKHTKGEWVVLTMDYPEEPKEIVTGVGVILSSNVKGQYTRSICDSILPETDEGYIKEHEEIKANMTLMAAAPEMLEKLIYIDLTIRLGGRIDPGSDDHNKIKELIRKAKS